MTHANVIVAQFISTYNGLADLRLHTSSLGSSKVLLGGGRNLDTIALSILLSGDHLATNDGLVLTVDAFGGTPFSKHYTGVHVRRRRGVGLAEQGDDAEQNSAHILGGVPTLARKFATLRIVDWRMQDGNAHVAVLHKIRQ